VGNPSEKHADARDDEQDEDDVEDDDYDVAWDDCGCGGGCSRCLGFGIRSYSGF